MAGGLRKERPESEKAIETGKQNRKLAIQSHSGVQWKDGSRLNVFRVNTFVLLHVCVFNTYQCWRRNAYTTVASRAILRFWPRERNGPYRETEQMVPPVLYCVLKWRRNKYFPTESQVDEPQFICAVETWATVKKIQHRQMSKGSKRRPAHIGRGELPHSLRNFPQGEDDSRCQ